MRIIMDKGQDQRLHDEHFENLSQKLDKNIKFPFEM